MSFSDRTRMLFGDAGVEALARARVAVYGLGGVGATCAMDLVRSGVGFLHVVDFDLVEESNLNRLYFGYLSTVGKPKTAAFMEAALDINPDLRIEPVPSFFSAEGAADAVRRAVGSGCLWHADCVDSLAPKANLIAALHGSGARLISSMGTAGRLDPGRLALGDFGEVRGCPLARALRKRLRGMGITGGFAAVWSDEPAVKPVPGTGRTKLMQGSAPFVPQAAGHFMASWIVRGILAGVETPKVR